MEEHHQRGVVAAVTELASSLLAAKGWLPNPVRRNKSEPQLQAAEPTTLFRSMWDDPTRNALSLLVAPRCESTFWPFLSYNRLSVRLYPRLPRECPSSYACAIWSSV